VTGPVFPDSFARNIIVTLEHMGHQVHPFCGTRVKHRQNRWVRRGWQELESALPQFVLAHQRQLVRLAREVKPDLVLVTGQEIFPEILAEVKRVINGPMVCWYTDPVRFLLPESRLLRSIRLFSHVFVKEPELASARGFDLLPEACNPLWHNRTPLTKRDCLRYGAEIAGIGTLHSHRAVSFEPFCDRRLKIWGNHIPRGVRSPSARHYTGQFVAEEEKAKTFLASDIVINTIGPWEPKGVNCTTFEIAGCGGFQIAAWKPSLDSLFAPDEEIVSYRSPAELRDKVNYYLPRKALRRQLADSAYRRAHAEHTYRHRLDHMLKTIESPRLLRFSREVDYS